MTSAGSLSSEAVVRGCLSRIMEREGTIHAWSHLDPELALRQARDCDRSPSRGPLHGVPVGIKDIIDTAGMPTERGTPIYAGRQPGRDADCVSRLRAAGCVILGKTVTTPLASISPVATANPHDPRRTAGGSSSGSAAAVADFMVPMALGTQTGGSGIRPAAFCGIPALKPTHGRVDMSGVMPVAPSLDTICLMARSIGDLTVLLSVLEGAVGETPQADLRTDRLRIGLCRTPHWSRADAAARRSFAEAGRALGAAGADVENLDLPESFTRLNEAAGLVIAAECATSFAGEYTDRRADMPTVLVQQIARGLAATPSDVGLARTAIAAAAADLALVFEGFDVLVTPSTTGEAPAGHDDIGDPIFNTMWTGLHVPVVTIPSGFGPNGLPLGIQLIGPLNTDHRLVAIAGLIGTAIAQPMPVNIAGRTSLRGVAGDA